MAASEYLRCREWLLPALREDTESDLIAGLREGRAQLWPGLRSAMVTQLLSGPDRLLHVWLAGGDMRDLLALAPGVEAWGRAQGAQYATINGRKGWARALRRTGFEPHGDGELRKAL